MAMARYSGRNDSEKGTFMDVLNGCDWPALIHGCSRLAQSP